MRNLYRAMTAPREPIPSADRFRGRATVLIVARLAKRTRIFRARDVVHPLLELLREKLRDYDCRCPAFCFLGSELRIVLVGTTDDAAPRQAFTEFWSESSRWLAGNRLPGWEPSFFNRSLASDAEIQEEVAGILELPVARSLGAKMTSYPYVGSLDPVEVARLEE